MSDEILMTESVQIVHCDEAGASDYIIHRVRLQEPLDAS